MPILLHESRRKGIVHKVQDINKFQSNVIYQCSSSTTILYQGVAFFTSYLKMTEFDPTQPYKFEPARISKSPNSITPGDLVFFDYPIFPYSITDPVKPRFTLVVSINRAPGGIFRSTRNNLLLSCFKVPYWNEQIMMEIINRLYKNRRRCNYYPIIRGLTALFGTDAFRTYDVKKMRHFSEITVKKNKGFFRRLLDWDWR